jgi:hypothetical protein
VSEGYVVLRKSTLAYLLECARLGGGLENVPEEAARDLGLAVDGVEAPVDEDRLRAVGPLLDFREHADLVAEEIDLPRGGQNAEFWKLVVRITLSILRNEAEAVRRVIASRSGDE